MPWTYVQGVSGHTITSALTLNLAGTTPAGHLLIATLTQFNVAPNTSGVTDTLGRSFTFGAGISNAGAGPAETEIWWFITPDSRPQQVSVAPVAYIAMIIDEYAPPPGTVALHASTTATGSSSSPAAGSIGAGASNLTVVGFGNAGSGATFTAGTGFAVSAAIPFSSGNNMGGVAEYKLSSAGTENPGGTFSASVPWMGVALSFTPGVPVALIPGSMITDGAIPSPIRRMWFPDYNLAIGATHEQVRAKVPGRRRNQVGNQSGQRHHDNDDWRPGRPDLAHRACRAKS